MKVKRIARPIIVVIATAILTIGSGLAFEGTAQGQPNSSAPANSQGDTNPDVKALVAAMSISRHAGKLVALSGPTNTTMTPESLNNAAGAIAERKAALGVQLEILAETDYEERTSAITRIVNDLEANAELIQQGRSSLLSILRKGIGNRQYVSLTTATDVVPAAETKLDDEFYRLVTGGQDGGSAELDSVPLKDLLRYVHLRNLATSLDLATPTLLGASTQDNPALAGQLHELFDGRASSAARDIDFLLEYGDPELDDVIQGIQGMFDLGKGDDNLWDGLYHRLGLLTTERILVAKVANLQQQLLDEIDNLAAEVQGLPQPSTMPMVRAEVPGVTDSEIKFGQSAVLTGPAQALGQGMQLGILAAFHQANQAGGIHGRELTLKTSNDHYETFFAFAGTSRLIGVDRVFGMIGSVGTPTTRAALPSVEIGNVPFIGAFTGAQLLRHDDQTNVLNVRASYHDETETMVDFLEKQGKTRVAVLYQNDSFGLDGLEGVQKALHGRDGMRLVGSWYYIRNTTAVKAAAYRIANVEPDSVIIIGAYAPAAEFIKYARLRLTDDPTFMAVSFVGSSALKVRLKELDQSLADVYVTEVVPLPSDESSEVVAAYRAALSEYDSEAEPEAISLEGYIAGRLAIARLQECGPDVTRECFLNVFSESTSIDIDGLQLQYGPGDNQGSDQVFLTRIDSGGE
ncbi:MAG: ABC transporter substrate-binding protein [Caldilineaceae bacterium]|nr:ABC transporter substrate-binding protein [Caldilineaceae bacterium]